MKYFFYLAALIAISYTSSQSIAGTYINETSDIVPGEYIVIFDDANKSVEELRTAEANLSREASLSGFSITAIWRNAVRGAAIAGLDEKTAHEIAMMPEVKSVSPNVYGKSDTTVSTTSLGLDRISQTHLPLDGFYNYSYTGNGVHVYVVDGPIRATHNDFLPNRATNDFDALGTNCGSGSFAPNHATAVASIIGGNNWGVARKVRIHGVRVTKCDDGNVTSANLISGLNWISANGVLPAVVNVSLNVPDSSGTVGTAVTNLISAGFFVAASAGNDSNTFCATAPAKVSGVLTVAASDPYSDQHAPYSNGGPCVGIYAPGVATAASSGSNTSAGGFSGTSAAAPHVAGYAALLYENSGYIPTPAVMRNHIVIFSNSGIIGAPAGTTNRQLLTTYPW